MNTYAERTRDSKSIAVANHLASKQNAGKPAFQFADHRPQAAAQRKLQEMADHRSKTSPAANSSIQLKCNCEKKHGSEEDHAAHQMKSKPQHALARKGIAQRMAAGSSDVIQMVRGRCYNAAGCRGRVVSRPHHMHNCCGGRGSSGASYRDGTTGACSRC
jgi:hypothetical protein